MSAKTLTERLPPIPEDKQTDAQKKATAALVSGSRKDVRGPFIALLRSPELLERAHAMGEYLRFRSVVPRKLRELAILCTARFWQQTYLWRTHVPLAVEAGLSEQIIDQLALNWDGAGLAPDEQVVLQFCRDLQRNHALSDSVYAQAKMLLGEDGVVELCGICGYQTLLAMTMNVARTAAFTGGEAAPFGPPD